ncbi:MAG: hypothetical protein WKF48_07075 [Solirubrobacteraceae bacterium]
MVEAERAARHELAPDTRAKIELVNYVNALDLIDTRLAEEPLQLTSEFFKELHATAMKGLGRDEDEHFKPHHEGEWRDGIALVVDRLTGKVMHEGPNDDVRRPLRRPQRPPDRRWTRAASADRAPGARPHRAPGPRPGRREFARRDYEAAAGVRRTAASEEISELIRHGVLVARGSGPATRYAFSTTLTAASKGARRPGRPPSWNDARIERELREFLRPCSPIFMGRMRIADLVTVHLVEAHQSCARNARYICP